MFKAALVDIRKALLRCTYVIFLSKIYELEKITGVSIYKLHLPLRHCHRLTDKQRTQGHVIGPIINYK